MGRASGLSLSTGGEHFVMPIRSLCVAISTVLALGAYDSSTASAQSPGTRWKPVRDEVFLQESGRKIVTDRAVQSIAVFQGMVYLGFGDGLGRLDGDKVVFINDLKKESIDRLIVLDAKLWAITPAGLYCCADEKWKAVAKEPVRDICMHAGTLYVATDNKLMRLADGKLVPAHERTAPGKIQRISSHADTLYCLASGRLIMFDGVSFDGEGLIDWGELPSKTTRDMYNRGDALLIATDRGLGAFRGASMFQVRGEQGLCYEDTQCIRAGFDNDYWIGTSKGAIRAVDGEYQYFYGDRWLPGEQVNDIACGDKVAYIATDKGLGIIAYEPFTLAKKAAYLERHLDEWGQKRLGFTYKLEWNEEKGGWVREISDNDGGWSADYLAAMAFKYAATKDPKALDEATNTFDSIRWLEQISGIPGFPARSIYSTHEVVNKTSGGSGGLPAEWNPTPDGNWEWKGDTSSDETDLHYFAFSIFHDIAATDKQKQQAKNFLSAISNHIIDNGWVLRDIDGLPTRWGRWDPGYLQRPYGWYARGLNGLEILTYMRTSHALTGNQKFLDGYNMLLGYGYQNEIIRQKLTFPPDYVNNSDDRMAFCMYYTMLRYERDPELRSIYMRGLHRSWEIERIEAIPFFNFIYGAITENDCDTVRAVKHLREWPLDMVNHSFKNSHRHDLHALVGMIAYAGGKKPLSPRERGPQRWTDSTLGEDGGSGGHDVNDPAPWLEAYWMGRYYGMILPPETTDPKLTTAEHRGLQLGAKPYDGPPRPPLHD
jgi:hypothetical protein